MADTIVENWRPVVGYEGLYSVSDIGRVRGEPRISTHPLYGDMPVAGRILKPATDQRGYWIVNLFKRGRGRTRYVHALMLEAFVGPRPPGFYCCHYDGTRSNNVLYNLRWDTPAGNSADAKRHGTNAKGEAAGHAKLTAADVRSIRAAPGPLRVIAERHGVHIMTVSDIRRGKTWLHVDQPPP